MTLQKTATLRIDSIAAGGRGVGRMEGMVVFVPRTAPDELVEISLVRHARFSEGKLLRIVEASSTRVAASCRHYQGDRCGGCQLQHMSYDAQLAAKRRIVHDSISRIARREPPPFELEPSAVPWHYRNKLTLALRRSGTRWIAGLRRFDAPDEVFSLTECPITSPAVLEGWREVMAASHLFPRVSELKGSVRETQGTRSFVLTGARGWQSSNTFADACGSFSLIQWVDENGRVHELVNRRSGVSSPASFEQVNPEVSSRMHSHVLALVRQNDPARVVDAYCGRGITTAELAREGREVVGIELDPSAVRMAREAAPPGAEIIEGRVEDVLHDRLPADAVVLNPPRAGVDKRVCQALESARPLSRRIVYVSCDPATLARDIGRLPSFEIASLRAFDMFPQTAHVETVCELLPRAA